jgi:tRNA-dihydrouridine synthase B
MRAVALEHLDGLYGLYGEQMGTRIARKHIGWYVERHPGGGAFRVRAMRIETAREQLAAVKGFFDELETCGAGPMERLAA